MKTKTPLTTAGARTGLASVLCAAAVLTLGGCATEPESHIVSAPPPASAPLGASTQPVVVQTVPQSGSASPAAQPSPQTIVVTQAPPAMQSEPVLEQPSSRHVWIPGYWSYRDGRYVWIAGRWEVPPRDGAMWVAPRWAREGTGYRFYEGYWN